MELLKSVKLKLLNKDAKIPIRASELSSGYDIFASEEKLIKRKSYDIISTGIALELEKGLEAQVRPRSGLAINYGITVLNSPGTIDADYRGEIKIILINHSDRDFLVEKGMRIAQLVFSKICEVEFIVTDNLNNTQRNTDGFGSTGYL